MNRTSMRGWSAACALALLLAGCSPAGLPASSADGKPLTAGSIVRKPDSGTNFMAQWQSDRGLEEILTPDELGNLEVRCADLRQADFNANPELLLQTSFDDQTQWPQVMPREPDLEQLMELGKDPGLGVRGLHDQGITGKGVGIAIIDQALLVEHQEYADRLRLYQEYHTASEDVASMHGTAVASIALGKTVGVAPEALLYYIADDVGAGTEENFVRDLSFYAQDIDRFIALNDTLPQGEKIRVISMSVGYLKGDPGWEEMDAAIARARAAGIAVCWVSRRDPLMEPFSGLGREPFGDPNDLTSCRPGQFWESDLYSAQVSWSEDLLVPMDRRTTATHTGPEGYAYYAGGGASWTVPYVAGLFALACQVKPDVTFEAFVQAAKETARPVSISHEGRDYPYGKVVDPAALLQVLQSQPEM